MKSNTAERFDTDEDRKAEFDNTKASEKTQEQRQEQGKEEGMAGRERPRAVPSEKDDKGAPKTAPEEEKEEDKYSKTTKLLRKGTHNIEQHAWKILLTTTPAILPAFFAYAYLFVHFFGHYFLHSPIFTTPEIEPVPLPQELRDKGFGGGKILAIIAFGVSSIVVAFFAALILLLIYFIINCEGTGWGTNAFCRGLVKETVETIIK